MKGDPKNYIPNIASKFTAWKEVAKYTRMVSREEIEKNDFNLSPSRCIQTAKREEYP